MRREVLKSAALIVVATAIRLSTEGFFNTICAKQPAAISIQPSWDRASGNFSLSRKIDGFASKCRLSRS